MIEEHHEIVKPLKDEQVIEDLACFGWQYFSRMQVYKNGVPALKLSFKRDTSSSYYTRYDKLFREYKLLQLQFFEPKPAIKFNKKWLIFSFTGIGLIIFFIASGLRKYSNYKTKKINNDLNQKVSYLCQEGKALVRMEMDENGGPKEEVKEEKESKLRKRIRILGLEQERNFEDISSL